MPKVKVNDITVNYEQQGTGEPLILIPFLAADNACYAFQVADYAKRFTCISIDPRGAGETDKPEGAYSTELFADDVAAFMQAIGVERLLRPAAHESGELVDVLRLGGVKLRSEAEGKDPLDDHFRDAAETFGDGLPAFGDDFQKWVGLGPATMQRQRLDSLRVFAGKP